MESLKKILLVVAAVLVTGCASTRQYVAFPDQSKSIEDPAMVRIYVMRPAFMGAAISMKVKDGNLEIGKTGSKGFLSWEREPGTATISSTAENTHSINVDVEKGMTYYILQHVRMGFIIARTKLELLTRSKGEEILKQCKSPSIGQDH